jgi:hypothetical protein
MAVVTGDNSGGVLLDQLCWRWVLLLFEQCPFLGTNARSRMSLLMD